MTATKRVLSIVLAVLLLCGAFMINAAAADIPEGFTPIYTAQDLDAVRNAMSGKYILMNDIDLAGWGEWSVLGSLFSGVFDGNGHSIKNLMMRGSANAGTNHAGLFDTVTGEVRNLNMVDLKIDIDPRLYSLAGGIAATVGGLSGANYSGRIVNCTTSGFVHAEKAGGIAGECRRSEITDCTNYAAVEGLRTVDGYGSSGYAAGIVCEMTSGSYSMDYPSVLRRCKNEGAVRGFNGAAGLVGKASGNSRGIYTYLIGCENSGSVTGANYNNPWSYGATVGGLAYETGWHGTVGFYDCVNSGTVSIDGATGAVDWQTVGGLVGYSYDSLLLRCANTGLIKGVDAEKTNQYENKHYVGGFIGCCSDAKAIRSYCTGNISAGGIALVGGIAGNLSGGSFYECYQSGTINGTNDGKPFGERGNGTWDIAAVYTLGGITAKNLQMSTLASGQFTRQESFHLFDFTNGWEISPQKNGGMPTPRVPEDPNTAGYTPALGPYFNFPAEEKISYLDSANLGYYVRLPGKNSNAFEWSCSDTGGRVQVSKSGEVISLKQPWKWNKKCSAVVTAADPATGRSASCKVTIAPNLLQWAAIVLLFGWIWM